jgi:glycosyltransferase involved in cell wall biosynthesis
MKLLVNAPINALSFGNVSVNILRELFKKNIDLIFFPIGDKAEMDAYDKIEPDFVKYLQAATNNRYSKISKDIPSLKLWHIFGSETRYSKNQSLFTFHEVSEVTNIEKNLLSLQDRIFVSSNYTKNIFNLNGLDNVTHVPLGFDNDFQITNKTYLQDKIHFGILGKFENRKNTARIIKSWLKLFGNKPEYQLSCAITNPFLDKARFQNELLKVLEGKQYNNLNFVPYMQTNSEVNDYLNSIDIDLGGLSGAEGWNLPSFNATALGRWSVVINATAHKDWATKDNSILIEPSSLKDCYDDIFFKKGQSFNQGQFFDISDQEMDEAILKSLSYAKTPNPEGLKLQKQFTYEKTVETILCAISSQM